MSLRRLTFGQGQGHRHLHLHLRTSSQSLAHFTSTARQYEESANGNGKKRTRSLLPDPLLRLQREARKHIKIQIAQSPICNQWITESPLLNFLAKVKTVWYGRIAYPPALTLRWAFWKTPTPPMTSIPPPPATSTLSKADGPLVWIDCEMTGLDFETDRILEIAVIITDGNLKPIDEGITYVIRTPKEVLDGMNEWCVTHHGASGLTRECLSDDHAREHADVRAAVLAYVTDRIPEARIACLAGNTVHADANFLRKEFPELIEHLHYRIVDVSSFKEVVHRLYGRDFTWRLGAGGHRALPDIKASISELQYYRHNFFKKPEDVGVVEVPPVDEQKM